MKLTIVYDNTAYRKDLQADWGFSAYIETKGKKILFDTGADGIILLSNMKKLNIDPKDVEDIFISHLHWDHTGGLESFLEENSNVKIWLPSFLKIKKAKEVIEVNSPKKLYEGIYSTGILDGIEQSLCIETKKGIVIIVGCSHPRMNLILKTASQFGKVYGLIGGLHGTKPEALKDLKLICPTHCTQYIPQIKSLYSERYIEGGAGRIIEIEE